MPKSKPPKLVVDLRRFLVKETAERGHAYWVDVHRPCEDLGVTLEELDEAIAYGSRMTYCGSTLCRRRPSP